MRAYRIALPLTLVVALFTTPPAASGSSLTLDTPPGINVFNADPHTISGTTVNGVTPQPAAFEAYHHADENNDGVINGPDGVRRAIGTYANGLFGLYSMCQSWGAFNATAQYVRTRGLLVIDDMIITTSEPSPPASLPVSVSFHVSGNTQYNNYAAHPEYIGASLDMNLTLNGTVFSGEYAWGDGPGGPWEGVSGLGSQIAGGAFAHDFSATVTTATANVPVNTPFTLRLEFTVSARSGGASGSAYGGLTFDARNTAGFLPDAPILGGLPEGYAVNSSDAGIVDNAVRSMPLPSRSATWGELKSLYEGGH